MAQSTVLQVRVEETLREKAEKILRKLGISPSQIVKMLYAQIVMRQGVPFALSMPQGKAIRHRDDIEILDKETGREVYLAQKEIDEGKSTLIKSDKELKNYLQRLAAEA